MKAGAEKGQIQPLGWKDLFLVFPQDSKAAPAVVRTAASGVSCIAYHSKSCSHTCTIMQVLNEPTHNACMDQLLLALSDGGEWSGSERVHHPVSTAAIDVKSQLQLPPVFPEEHTPADLLHHLAATLSGCRQHLVLHPYEVQNGMVWLPVLAGHRLAVGIQMCCLWTLSRPGCVRCNITELMPEVLDCTSGNGRFSTKASWDHNSRIFIADSQLRSLLGCFTGTGSPLDERELNSLFMKSAQLPSLHALLIDGKTVQQVLPLLKYLASTTPVCALLNCWIPDARTALDKIVGVCCGFSVMGSCESPNTPFTIFKTRFETVPKTIIYDNACNLHSYFLNRDRSQYGAQDLS